jgi:hypothetical protein
MGHTKMTPLIKGQNQGRDVRIDFGMGEVWIRHVQGGLLQRTEEWKKVPLGSLILNTWYPQSIETPDGRYSIKDLSLTLQDISRGLGVMRLDGESAERIWTSASVLKGKFMAVDFGIREIALKPSPLVLPFNSIAGVLDKDPPDVVYKHHGLQSGKHSAEDLPISGTTLAEQLGVPLIRAVV